MQKVKIGLITAVILIVLLIFSIPYITQEYHEHFIEGKNPFQIIKKDLSIELPESMQVLQYSYEEKTGYFAVKMQLEQQEVETVSAMLLQRFPQEAVHRDIDYQEHLSWWDVQETQVVASYHGIASTPYGKQGVKTVPVWAYISRDDAGNFLLYLDKYWCSEMEE